MPPLPSRREWESRGLTPPRTPRVEWVLLVLALCALAALIAVAWPLGRQRLATSPTPVLPLSRFELPPGDRLKHRSLRVKEYSNIKNDFHRTPRFEGDRRSEGNVARLRSLLTRTFQLRER